MAGMERSTLIVKRDEKLLLEELKRTLIPRMHNRRDWLEAEMVGILALGADKAVMGSSEVGPEVGSPVADSSEADLGRGSPGADLAIDKPAMGRLVDKLEAGSLAAVLGLLLVLEAVQLLLVLEAVQLLIR